MQRLVGYMAAAMASSIGWKLGSLAGPFIGYFLAILAAAVTLYTTRRWLRSAFG